MPSRKYELGIAFSGGGCKAAAHCGALQALKEFGIKPDVVAGTSAGSLVAAFYSAGYQPVQMIEIFSRLNFFKDIVTMSKPRGGLFESTPLLEIIREHLPYGRIEDLPIPTYIVAADMDNGVPTVFSKGETAPRLVASCSIPIVFKPMIIDGIHYIDGGVFQNLPVPAIRNLCNKVIAFSVRKIDAEDYKDNILYTATRAYSMMFMSNIMADSKLADVYIELDTSGCSVYDMSRISDLFHRGYRDACLALESNGYSRVMAPESIVLPENVADGIFNRKDSSIKRKIATINKELELKIDEKFAGGSKIVRVNKSLEQKIDKRIEESRKKVRRSDNPK